MTDQLCHRCRRIPMVTTVSDGAREVALCLECLRELASEAIARSDYPGREVEDRKAWHRVLKES